MPAAVRNYDIQEVDDADVDYELLSPNQLVGSHANMIPQLGNVQATRPFYGARFFNQANSLVGGEAPLVQTLIDGDEMGRTFDEHYGERSGALRADDDYEVLDVNPDGIRLRNAAGEEIEKDLYNNLPFNRKSMIFQRPLVKVGDRVTKGSMLAASNFTDDGGALAMGLNARVGLVPFKGYTTDDAVAVSDSFAKKLRSISTETFQQDIDDQNKGGRGHFQSLFPERYTKDQLERLDDDGVVQPGSILNPGDPIILATRPRVLSSGAAELGKLSKTMRQVRSDASQLWENDSPGKVIHVAKTKDGIKVITAVERSAANGDKITFRHGQKGTISTIIPDDHMPRTADGRPLEVLLNPQGMPSRANVSTLYELWLGKVAAKTGKPVKIPMFDKPGVETYDYVQKMLDDAGLTDLEEVFDPKENRKLEKPVTVGVGYVQALHHTASCYDEETEVLTSTGWKFWRHVTAEDQLATVAEDKRSLRFERPLHLMVYDYAGLMCAFEGRYLDYCVTPNHMMWVKPYYGKSDFGFRSAADIHGKRWTTRQFGFLVEDTEDDARRFPVEARDFDWGDFCELTGWWLAEGCTAPNETVIYQSSTANPAKLQRIEALVTRMGLSWKPFNAHQLQMGVRILDKDVLRFFRAYGSKCDQKRTPRVVVEGPAFGCRRLLESLVLGDGNTQKTATGPSTRFAVTSRQLIDDFQEVAVRAGWGSVIRYDVKPDGPAHHLPVHKASLTTSRGRSQLDGDRNEGAYKLVPYVGRVYCAEMSTGLLYVRRNGKPLLCGNSKIGARGQGGYDLNQLPAKGGHDGAKRLSGLEVHALLSSGAYATLREGMTIRGQRNDEYWRTLRAGNTPRDPDEPFVWRKFRALMSGSGLRMRDEPGGNIRLGPLTDADLDKHGPMEIQNPKTVNLKTLEPEKGGLFDTALVGGNKWGVIPLPEPVLNPAFEGVARNLLGLKLKDLQAILAGEMELPDHLKKRVAEHARRAKVAATTAPLTASGVVPTPVEPGGALTGPMAIRAALEATDIDEVERDSRKLLERGLVSKRKEAVTTLNAVAGLRSNQVKPAELMVTRIPVIPPAFRPFSLAGDTFIAGDANELYKDLFQIRDAFTEARDTFGDMGVTAERKALQEAVKSVYGYADPVNPKSKARGVAGFLRQVSGTSPKFGWFQRKLISKPQDQVARGVITPDPELNIDEIGLPETMAWDLYGTYLMRRLVRKGMDRSQALREIKERSKWARTALNEEMEDRHVVYSRAPAWHKYNIVSGKPVLIDGDTIRISPMVAAGHGADYDGDQMNVHVPASDEAVQEAREKLKPSNMLFSIKDPDKVVPKLIQEQVLGIYTAGQRPSRGVTYFPSRAAALAAIQKGQVSLRDEIEFPDGV